MADWRLFDGYSDLHQLVEDGRIIGSVHGSRFEKSRGWVAYLDYVRPSEWLGRYTTAEAAKRAVEWRAAEGKR